MTATAANFTNYNGGINGVMFDLAHAGAAAAIDAADLGLAVGNSGDPSTWQSIAATTIDVREGGGRGGSDRVVLTWPDSPVRNTWLQVTVLSSGSNTGLLEDDVFYFGNTIGKTVDGVGSVLVNAADVITIRDNPRGEKNPVSIDHPYDVNRDKFVDAVDLILARNNTAGPLAALQLIAPT